MHSEALQVFRTQQVEAAENLARSKREAEDEKRKQSMVRAARGDLALEIADRWKQCWVTCTECYDVVLIPYLSRLVHAKIGHRRCA